MLNQIYRPVSYRTLFPASLFSAWEEFALRVVTCTLRGVTFLELVSPDFVGVSANVVTLTLLGVFSSAGFSVFLEVGVVLSDVTSILRGVCPPPLFADEDDDGVLQSVVTCTLRGVLFSPVLSPLSRLVGVVDKVVTCTLRALGVDGVTMSLPSPEGSTFDSVLELFVTVVTSTLLGCGFPSLAVSTKPCPGVFPG